VKIRVLWFGRPSVTPYSNQVETYRSRVRRRWPADDQPLRPAAGGRDADPHRALKAEAEIVRRKVSDGWVVVVLDESGKGMSSEEFARWLGGLEDRGVAGVAFVIGSDLGTDSALKASADRTISLGAMTWPHQMARVMLWEQLYRSVAILEGGGYHRLCVQ
jgi:23S rRNA (pseudouridine1915-N3)-methyltransferase